MRFVSLSHAVSMPTLVVTFGLLMVPGDTRVRAQEAAPVDAQEARAPTPAAQTPAPAPAAAPARSENERRMPPAQNVNVRMDITITDQAGSNPPVTKTLNVIAADRENGSIRTKIEVPLPKVTSQVVGGPPSNFRTYQYEALPLNIDIRPELVEGGRIKARLILNYETATVPKGSSGDEPYTRAVVTANMIVVLENGKPLVVTQSADATTDRKVTVELKATILK